MVRNVSDSESTHGTDHDLDKSAGMRCCAGSVRYISNPENRWQNRRPRRYHTQVGWGMVVVAAVLVASASYDK